MGLALLTGGCGKRSADRARLEEQLRQVRHELTEQLAEHRKHALLLRGRVARLEAELALLKRPPPRQRAEADPGGDPRPDPVGADHRPAPRASCPAALPEAARGVRRRMRVAKLRKLLAGVKVSTSKALTLSGAGSRTRLVWSGPCFRITLEGGRVTSVELEGVVLKRRRRRRRRR